MPDNNEKFYAGHRERLRAKFLDGKLADYEKLELLLTYVIPRRDVRPLSRSLIKQFGGVYQVFTASVNELMSCKGIGINTAIFIKLVHEMMTVNYKYQMRETPIFHDEKILHNYCRMILGNKPVEELHILYLNKYLQLISDEIHTTGTVDCSNVFPREIAKRALELNARSVVMVHNHPGSMDSHSSADLEITQRLKIILSGLDIELYDHLVVANDSVYSARQMHMLH